MRFKLLLVLFLTPLCLAQTGSHRIGQVLVKGNNIAANVAPYASVMVCVANTGCATAANVFSDQSLTVPLTLPLVADGSGNYDYYVGTGCVDEQISAPGSEAIFLPNVCPFNGTGGANLTAGAVQFATSVSVTRAATFADIASLFTGTTPCYLKSDGTCSESSGGGSPAGVNTDLQINGSGSFAADSGNLKNNSTTHTLFQKQINNLPYASQYSTGNNGIATFFAAFPAANQTLIVDSGDGAETIPPGLMPAGTILQDYRAATGSAGYKAHNCITGVTSAPTLDQLSGCQIFETWNDSALVAQGGSVGLFSNLAIGAGYSGDFNSAQGTPWTVSSSPVSVNSAVFRPSIQNGLVVNCYKQSDGDQNCGIFTGSTDGGRTAGSDQGVTGIAGQFSQQNTRTYLVVQSTTGTGDTSPQSAPYTGTIFQQRLSSGLDEWLLDFSKGGPGSSGTVTFAFATSFGSGLTPGTYTVPCTGGGGSGATLTVIVEAGASSLQINPHDVFVATQGSGYSSAPTCTLTAAGGTPPVIATTIAYANTVTATGTPVPGSSYLNMMTMGSATGVPITGDCLTTSAVQGNSNPGHYTTDTVTCTVQNNHPLIAGLFWNTGGNSGSSLPERDNIISVSGGTTTGSTQTVVLQHVSSIVAGTNFYQGGTNGCVSFDEQYVANAIFGCDFAYGFYDSSHLIYGKLVAGSQNGRIIPAQGDMFAGLTTPINKLHVYLGIPILYTELTIPGNTGTVGGTPTLQKNDVPWAVNDVMIQPQSTAMNFAGGLLLDLSSNGPANGDGDAGIALVMNGNHWTSAATGLLLTNGNTPASYTGFGGSLNAPTAIGTSGVYENIMRVFNAPQDSFGSIIKVTQDSSTSYSLFSGTQEIRVDNASHLFNFGTSGVSAGGFTGGGLELTDAFGNQFLGTNFGPTVNVYTTLSSATGYDDAVFTAGQLVSGSVVVGAQNPNYTIGVFPTGSGTSYAWSVGCTDSSGGVTVPVAGPTGSGPASLSSSNFYEFGINLSPGCQTAALYRVTGPGGAGAICTGITPTQGRLGTCKDIGQTAGAAAPTRNTSGVLNVAAKIETGASANTDLAGQLTLAAGTASYSFASTYSSPPICSASDTTTAAAVKVSATTSVLTLTGTGSDVLNFVCIGRN